MTRGLPAIVPGLGKVPVATSTADPSISKAGKSVAPLIVGPDAGCTRLLLGSTPKRLLRIPLNPAGAVDSFETPESILTVAPLKEPLEVVGLDPPIEGGALKGAGTPDTAFTPKTVLATDNNPVCPLLNGAACAEMLPGPVEEPEALVEPGAVVESEASDELIEPEVTIEPEEPKRLGVPLKASGESVP